MKGHSGWFETVVSILQILVSSQYIYISILEKIPIQNILHRYYERTMEV